jgi:hypothetical protein
MTRSGKRVEPRQNELPGLLGVLSTAQCTTADGRYAFEGCSRAGDGCRLLGSRSMDLAINELALQQELFLVERGPLGDWPAVGLLHLGQPGEHFPQLPSDSVTFAHLRKFSTLWNKRRLGRRSWGWLARPRMKKPVLSGADAQPGWRFAGEPGNP